MRGSLSTGTELRSYLGVSSLGLEKEAVLYRGKAGRGALHEDKNVYMLERRFKERDRLERRKTHNQ